MATLRFVVGVVIACLLLRTFVALGVVEPVAVAGKSMAPRLVEENRLVVDRLSPVWRPLERWDRVVARLPDNATRLGVKRILGLPGERVEFREGDLWVDNKRVRKTLNEQLATRLLVHRESPSDRRWEANAGGQLSSGDTLLFGDQGLSELAYTGGLIHDDLAINSGVTRRLNPVADLMLTGSFRLPDQGVCEIVIARGGQAVRFTLMPGSWRLTTDAADAAALLTGQLSPQKTTDERRVVFSLFDQQATVAIDEKLIAGVPLPPMPEPITEPQRLTLRMSGGVEARDLAVWRDVYYERRPIDLAPADRDGAWRLGPDRWFLVGDNQAVSLDSRSWRTAAPGVPGRLIVGRLAED